LRILLTAICLIIPLNLARGADEARILETVSRANQLSQPALQNYQVDLEINRINELVDQLSSKAPPNNPPQEEPEIRKYWIREAGRTVVRAEKPLAKPIQELIKHYSGLLELDLADFILPVKKSTERSQLVARAEVKASENRIGNLRLKTLSIRFPQPVSLDGAFFSPNLDLPQDQVVSLNFDFDLNREVLQRLELQTTGQLLTLEIRYFEVRGGQLPVDILITSPDGSVDDRIQTRFGLVEGFWLPDKQTRINHRKTEVDGVFIKFRDYVINGDLPGDVRARVGR